MLSAALCCLGSVNASAAPDAKAAFEARQQDLIRLAGSLGALHRYHQMCGNGNNPDLFRNRMRQLVPLEAPMESTRQSMISAFNTRFRQVSNDYLTCSGPARQGMEEETQRALVISERLFRAFR
ncbi:TIGR02301 family protein [Parvularcula sp. LCG005]|uniref:TIGR02301 family protein n=1 Tax=Parvularcula sp. LCG005 TaxID=3078805 RepID=UPI00294318FD|nr:TIGR02301 family protein [Parvularcula sp. LCG005]WOI54732.1 TIGR02301 family protein [Parvularcula sp. LCG005]